MAGPADSPDAPPASASPDLEAERRRKGAAWREHGFAPYGNDPGPLTPIGAVLAAHAAHDAAALEQQPATTSYRVAGRLMLHRASGKKLQFAQLRDATGTIQLFISQAELGERAWPLLAELDLGDVVLAEGAPMRTKSGELSIKVRALRPLTKALRAPSKWDTVDNVEMRYRQRYVDLIENWERVAPVFRARSLIVRALREFLDERGFLEVETPVLQPLRGGALAKPFRTHHNALDMELYLRIAPELYLKRLTVGGFDRVYEIGRMFRNEGISTRHNPEFTMLEFYQAYATYVDLMDTTEQLFAHVDARVRAAHPSFIEARRFTLAEPFRRVRMRDALAAALAKRAPELASRWALLGGAGDFRAMQSAVLAHERSGLAPEERSYVSKSRTAGELLFALYEVFAEKHLAEDYRTADRAFSVPVFITDYPYDVSPLARRKDASVQEAQYGALEVDLVDRFELFVEGRELCNAFSELNDPDDQAERFRAQLANRAAGDEEAMDFDADYIRALACGMPPAAGFGLGVDRFVMALTGQDSIRDVVLFPQLRREAKE